jgi:RimJ/RimL family protein N-acetyltransferase
VAHPPFDRVALIGEHVRLEPLEDRHLSGLRSAADVDRSTFVLAAVPRPTDDDVRWYLDEADSLHATARGLAFATIDVTSGTVVGSTRFMNAEYWTTPDRRERPGVPPDAVEIGGTWLTPSAQRTGANTDAKLLMLAHAFDVLAVLRVTIKTDARNARSRANIERVGGVFEGVLRSHMRASDGEVRDTAMYSILSSEWPSVRERLSARLRPPSVG